MARYYVLILKIVNALIFLWLITVFFSIFHFDSVLMTEDGELVLVAFIESLRNILTFLIFSLSYVIALGCALVASIIFIGYNLQQVMFRFIEQFFRGLLSLWFTFPSGDSPELSQILDLIGNEVGVFSENLYLIAFQILFIVSIIYAIRGFLITNPKNDMIAIGALVLMLVIPLMVFGFRDMLDLFNMQIPYLEDLANPLDPSLNVIPLDDIFLFFASPVILLAIISYLYLEFSFQINYTFTVTKPSMERRARLEAQLNILQSESHYITANVDKIKQEAKKRKEELEISEKATVTKFFAKTDESFSYVKEMIAKKKLEEEEKKLITAASKTRRLGRYINRLFHEDSEAQDTLTARSSAPRPKSLVVSTASNFAFRVGLLIVISFIIIHPKWFLEDVFNLPTAITESVAILSPEVIVIILIPLILIFPLISKIISAIKHRNLIIRLQQEGRIKEILASVGDYVKKHEESVEEEVETIATEN